MTIAINIRGTGGSGKSTVVKRIMELYGKSPVMTDGRKRPIGYEMTRGPLPTQLELYVPGHYETACGGCDTIKTVDQVYTEVRAYLRTVNVLYEGIMVQDDVRRAVELSKEHKLHVIRLSTPIEECLTGIRARREARGEEKPLNEKNTRGRYESVIRTCARLKDAGVAVEVLDREAAFLRIRELLGV